MKVSVLIPAYNSEKEIYTCIRSLLEQTYHDFEVIAVDDGSTDRTGSRLDFYAKIHPELITVIHQENRGVSAARNAALKGREGRIHFVSGQRRLDEAAHTGNAGRGAGPVSGRRRDLRQRL